MPGWNSSLKGTALLVILGLAWGSSASAQTYSSQQNFNESGLVQQKLVRALKPVLLNHLYRGGGPGGKVTLSKAGIQGLCHAGFSSAFYLYPDNWSGPKTENCQDQDGQANTFTYQLSGFRGRDKARPVLEAVYKSIKNKGGPVFVHCWNGWHASGEVAAYALIQFCGMSGEAAGRYWQANVGDKGNLPKYGSIVRHIENFRPFDDLKISPAEQADICPVNKY